MVIKNPSRVVVTLGAGDGTRADAVKVAAFQPGHGTESGFEVAPPQMLNVEHIDGERVAVNPMPYVQTLPEDQPFTLYFQAANNGVESGWVAGDDEVQYTPPPAVVSADVQQ